MEVITQYLNDFNLGDDKNSFSNIKPKEFLYKNDNKNNYHGSSFDFEDQSKIDDILYYYKDIISNNLAFQKIKDFEDKYGAQSNTYYKKWMQGKVSSSPEIITWMNLYRNVVRKDKYGE